MDRNEQEGQQSMNLQSAVSGVLVTNPCTV